jgi:glycosyltransferase involved in cell wall biosynthesis
MVLEAVEKTKPAIGVPFLLVVAAPYVQDREGRIWLDRLWHRDFLLHCDYLKDLTVLAPRRRVDEPPEGFLEVIVPESKVRFVEFAPVRGRFAATLALPLSIARSWAEVGKAEIVQSGVAGWPYPPGLFANLFASMRKRPLIIIVESAFWRKQHGKRSSRLKELLSGLHEAFARWSLSRAAVGIFTQGEYAQSLPTGPNARSAVIPASWIEEGDLIPFEEAEGMRAGKLAESRFLVASRLTADKGIPFLLDAIEEMDRRRMQITIDVMGTGAFEARLRALSENLQTMRLTVKEPVPYGKPFFSIVKQYSAVIVPTTGDEQSRIIFDAFSQAVPVITTDTAGNREVVQHGRNGVLASVGDTVGFALAIEQAAKQPDMLVELGLEARRSSATHTHHDMHRKRASLILEILATR